jgi:hypothetical protein
MRQKRTRIRCLFMSHFLGLCQDGARVRTAAGHGSLFGVEHLPFEVLAGHSAGQKHALLPCGSMLDLCQVSVIQTHSRFL